MLQKISDKIQGWIAGIIVAIIAAVFALWGMEYYLDRGNDTGSKAVATVNGKKITVKQVNALARQLQARVQMARPNQPITPQQQNEIKSLALQELIAKKALTLAAEKQGFAVSQQAIQQIILQAPEFQVKGLFSPQRFQQFLLMIQSSEAEFLNEIRSNFLVNQVAVGIENSAFSLPNELNKAYQLIYQKRDFGYFTVPLSRFLENIKLSDKEIQQYYQQHKESYKTTAKVKMNYVVLSPAVIEKSIKIPPDDLKSYYQSNKAAFTTPKQWKVLRVTVPVVRSATPKQIATVEKRLQKIYLQTKRGKSFESAVKAAGLTASTNIYTPATVSTTVANALSTLKPGQISKPFHTQQGVNLVKLISMTPRKMKTFAQVKNEIQQRLARQKAQQIFSKKNDQLATLTYTNPNTLVTAAKKLGLTIQTSPWLTKEGLKKGVFANHAAIAAAFSDDVLRSKNNSNPVNLPNGAVMVMRVNQYLPSRVQTLAEVKQTIQKVLTKNKAQSKAGLEAYQISSALSKGVSPQTLAKRYDLEWVAKSNVERDSKLTPQPILASVFSTPPEKDKKISGINTLVLANGDYIILKVMSANLADISQVSKQKLQKLQIQLTHLMGELDYRLYAKSIMNDAKITIKTKNSK